MSRNEINQKSSRDELLDRLEWDLRQDLLRLLVIRGGLKICFRSQQVDEFLVRGFKPLLGVGYHHVALL
eukprot:m.38566 g.38566  ORF g.38566 m.38566 type:complete len:69 (-) comp45304_c0_seq3:441-647(-)